MASTATAHARHQPRHLTHHHLSSRHGAADHEGWAEGIASLTEEQSATRLLQDAPLNAAACKVRLPRHGAHVRVRVCVCDWLCLKGGGGAPALRRGQRRCLSCWEVSLHALLIRVHHSCQLPAARCPCCCRCWQRRRRRFRRPVLRGVEPPGGAPRAGGACVAEPGGGGWAAWRAAR